MAIEGSNHSDYAQAIKGLSLGDLYYESERFERLAEQWGRRPNGESQVKVARKRVEIIEREIERRYAAK